jgi:glycine hydroxymethyltransferase
MQTMPELAKEDPGLADLIVKESVRIESTLDLIAAEHHPPIAIFEALGSILTIKTIEGYPGRRFHAGCVHADAIETLAITRAKRLFGAEHANVQALSGTAANMAVYFSVLANGDAVLSMNLAHGGHLSHGHRASITSRCFKFTHYGVDPETERIDYDQVRRLAQTSRPKMIVAGASAYPRLIDYAVMGDIAKSVGAYLLVDMAHIAGLVAAGVIPSPVPHSDFVTFTGYKTLMGGRGGIILSTAQYARRIDRTIFPGCQGTSPVNLIAAKALAFKHARSADFVRLQQRTVENAKALAAGLGCRGWRMVTGGTDNHQVIIDVGQRGITGQAAQNALEAAGIVTNRNAISADADRQGAVSGLRMGTGAMSARGMGSEEAVVIADRINRVLTHIDDQRIQRQAVNAIRELCTAFPVYRHAGWTAATEGRLSSAEGEAADRSTARRRTYRKDVAQ